MPPYPGQVNSRIDPATQAELDAAVAAAVNDLIAGAPGALDTLNELAAALGDDANFAAAIATAIAAKQPLDADLTALAGLATDPFGLELLTKPTAAAIRTYIDAVQVGATVPLDGSYAATTTDVASSRVTADTNPRFTWNADGKLEWGPGNAALDIGLRRVAAGALKTDGEHWTAGKVYVFQGQAAQVLLGDAGPSSKAGIQFGSAGDTNLYRSAADTLKTDDSLLVANISANLNNNTNTFGTKGGAGGIATFGVNYQGGTPITTNTVTAPTADQIGMYVESVRAWGLRVGSQAGATNVGGSLMFGSGAPVDASGTDGDIYLRVDGGALTTIYQRRAGAWVGIV